MAKPNPELDAEAAQGASSVPIGGDATHGETAKFVRKPGETLPRIFGRYELRALLGRGGMGSVYQAFDPQLDRMVALKIPKAIASDVDDWRERFKAEAQAAATLHHPNICPVFEVGEVLGEPYLTMPLIQGETLAARVKQTGKMPIDEAVSLVSLVARAMSEAHQRGIVHRDLKPANLLIDRRGQPIIMDFGLAFRTTNTSDLRLTLSGVAVGTPEYMPPEQAGGEHESIGPSSDVYSLGVILNELVTGQVPFRAPSFGKLIAQIERDPPPRPSLRNKEVSANLEAVILKSLEKAPSDRFPSATAFANALDAVQRGDSIGAWVKPKSASILPEAKPSSAVSQRSRWAMVLGGLAGLALAAVVVVMLWNTWAPGEELASQDDKSASKSIQKVVNVPPLKLEKSTVVEIPGWTILANAPKAEAQAWLDDQKQRKHSVAWLDVTQIEGEACYSALSEHEGNQKDWIAYLDVTLEEFNDLQKLGKRVDLTRYFIQSAAGSVENEEMIFAELFHEGARPDGSIGALPLDGLKAKIPGLVTRSQTARMLRPFVMPDGKIEVAALFETSTNKLQLFDLLVEKSTLDKAKESFRQQGHFPYAITPTETKGELAFSYSFCDLVKKEVEWEHHLDWTTADFAAKAGEMASKGFHPESIVGYARQREVCYSTIWLKDKSSPTDSASKTIAAKPPQKPVESPKTSTRIELPGWTILADASKKEAQKWVEERKAANQSLMALDVVSINESPVYSAICAKDERNSDWIAMLDIPDQDIIHPENLADRVDQLAYAVKSVSGFREANRIRCAALFSRSQSGNTYVGLAGLLVLEQKAADLVGPGHRARLLRPVHKGGNLYECAFYFVPTTNNRQLHEFNVDEENYRATISSLAAKQLFPHQVVPFVVKDELRYCYTISDEPSDIKFEHYLDWTATDLKAKSPELIAKGFSPESIIGYPWNGAVRYSTVWLKEPSKAAP